MFYKPQIISLIALCLVILSCKPNNDKPNLAANQHIIDSLKLENEKLKNKAEDSDQSLTDFVQAFNDINKNLEEIKRKEDIISIKTQNMENGKGFDVKQIQENISAIYDLLQENKETVNNLRNKLEGSNMINADMQQSLNLLSHSIETKNNEITQLRNTLSQLNFQMEELNQKLDSIQLTNQEKDLEIKTQKEILNTGYYIVGTFKELLELGIVERKGGIAGIGSISHIDDNFDTKLFTKININETKKIPLKYKRAKVLSTHPAEAYKFYCPDNIYDKLIITQPKNFWSTSKYLVIEVEK